MDEVIEEENNEDATTFNVKNRKAIRLVLEVKVVESTVEVDDNR